MNKIILFIIIILIVLGFIYVEELQEGYENEIVEISQPEHTSGSSNLFLFTSNLDRPYEINNR
jgi:hypothetical protein